MGREIRYIAVFLSKSWRITILKCFVLKLLGLKQFFRRIFHKKELVIITKKPRSLTRACLMIVGIWFRKPRKKNGWSV